MVFLFLIKTLISSRTRLTNYYKFSNPIDRRRSFIRVYLDEIEIQWRGRNFKFDRV